MTVYVCDDRDIECGDNPAAWCAHCPRRPRVEIPVEAQRIAAFEAGWHMASEWAQRDDLPADMDSPAYIAERKARLAALFGAKDSNG